MRALSVTSRADLDAELARVGADPASWGIFWNKAATTVLKIEGLSVASANILKQTALTAGADCAVHRDVITGRARRSDALLFGTRRQLDAVAGRLDCQPECVARVAPQLRSVLDRLAADPVLDVAGRRLAMAGKTYVMGVVNVTPDSFSDGGRFLDPGAAADQALKLAGEGADLLDIGAESTRPGSRPVEPLEQVRRLRPVLRRLKRQCGVPVSVDTTSPRVARMAADEGAAMINDVSALGSDAAMLRAVRQAGVAYVMMHMKGRPRTMQRRPAYRDLMGELVGALAAAAGRAVKAGIERGRLVVDPGIGFGKSFEHNHEILRRIAELRTIGLPVMVGPSRKAFIGALTGGRPDDRLEGTIAACLAAAAGGASIVRVHDVGPVRKALTVFDAIRCGGRA